MAEGTCKVVRRLPGDGACTPAGPQGWPGQGLRRVCLQPARGQAMQVQAAPCGARRVQAPGPPCSAPAALSAPLACRYMAAAESSLGRGASPGE